MMGGPPPGFMPPQGFMGAPPPGPISIPVDASARREKCLMLRDVQVSASRRRHLRDPVNRRRRLRGLGSRLRRPLALGAPASSLPSCVCNADLVLQATAAAAA